MVFGSHDLYINNIVYCEVDLFQKSLESTVFCIVKSVETLLADKYLINFDTSVSQT